MKPGRLWWSENPFEWSVFSESHTTMRNVAANVGTHTQNDPTAHVPRVNEYTGSKKWSIHYQRHSQTGKRWHNYVTFLHLQVKRLIVNMLFRQNHHCFLHWKLWMKPLHKKMTTIGCISWRHGNNSEYRQVTSISFTIMNQINVKQCSLSQSCLFNDTRKYN